MPENNIRLNKAITKHQAQSKRNPVRDMNSLPVTQCIKWPWQAPSLAALGLFFLIMWLTIFKHRSLCHARWNRQSQGFLLAFKSVIPTVMWYPAARNQKQQALIAHYPDGVCQTCSWNHGSAELKHTTAIAHLTLNKCSWIRSSYTSKAILISRADTRKPKSIPKLKFSSDKNPKKGAKVHVDCNTRYIFGHLGSPTQSDRNKMRLLEKSV